MNDDLFALVQAFVHAARHLNVGHGAKTLGVSAATISRRITRLEDRIGARLLVRTTRRIALTAVGDAYLARCENVLAALEGADLAVAVDSGASVLSGRLRVTAPSAFGRRCMAPILCAFAELHPEIELEVVLSDEVVDIVKHDIDVAVRMAALADSSLVARRLADNRRGLYAAPSYLLAHGVPKRPAELAQHHGLLLSGYGDSAAWTFRRGGAGIVGLPRSALRTNDAELLLHFALAGQGVAILPDFLASDAVERGSLQPLLPSFVLRPSAVYGVHVTRRLVPARIRIFLDFLAERLRPKPPAMGL